MPPPGTIDFGDQAVNAISGPRTATLTNTGNVVLHLTGASHTRPFFLENTNCPTAGLAPGASCQLTGVFIPTALGAASGSLTVTASEGAEATIATSGTGVAPSGAVVQPSITSWDFGEVELGTESTHQTVTLTNTGTAPGHYTGLIGVVVPYGFHASDGTCSGAIAPGGSCQIEVWVTPRQLGGVNAGGRGRLTHGARCVGARSIRGSSGPATRLIRA